MWIRKVKFGWISIWTLITFNCQFPPTPWTKPYKLKFETFYRKYNESFSSCNLPIGEIARYAVSSGGVTKPTAEIPAAVVVFNSMSMSASVDVRFAGPTSGFHCKPRGSPLSNLFHVWKRGSPHFTSWLKVWNCRNRRSVEIVCRNEIAIPNLSYL